MSEGVYRRLLVRSGLALVICSVLVVVCYYWIDRPVAELVHRDGVDKHRVFRWLTDPPPLVEAWSPLALVLLMVRRAWGPFSRWQLALLAACLALIVADVFRTSVGDIFGRYWPETWFHNPSFIGTGVYGFRFFSGGDDVGSFPSGHCARIFAFASVWWIALPRTRVLVALVALPLAASLVLMNYHFVSDAIAGSVLGALVGAYAAALAGLCNDAGN